MRIQLRRGTAAQWAAVNPVLASGEPAVATDTGVLKIGDGATAYTGLPSIGAGGGTIIDPIAAALGLATHTFSPYLAPSANSLGAGVFVAMRVYLPGTAIGHLSTWVTNAGVTASGRNGLAYYRDVSPSSATLVDATGDMSAAFAATGEAAGALAGGTQTPAAGAYWLSMLVHFSGTDPKIGGVAAAAGVPAINGKRSSIFIGGVADFPASFDPSAASLNNGGYYLAAY